VGTVSGGDFLLWILYIIPCDYLPVEAVGVDNVDSDSPSFYRSVSPANNCKCGRKGYYQIEETRIIACQTV